MHNLHLIVVNADSAQEAANEVTSEILEWGNDNNWRSIGGVASEDGSDDIQNLEKAGWGLAFLDDLNLEAANYFKKAIAYHHRKIIQPFVINGINGMIFDNLLSALKAVANELQQFDCLTSKQSDLWRAEQNIKLIGELFSAKQSLEAGSELPEFFSWEFSEYGLTDLTAQTEGEKRYIVFLDMHS